MKKVVWLILVSALLIPLNSCRYGNQSGWDEEGNLYGRISISGAWAMYPLVVRWAEEFRKEHPRVLIDISAGGAGKGMADVLGNMVELAMVSRDINPVETEKGAWYLAVAKDAVVPTFNENNPLKTIIRQKGMTRKQLQLVFLNQETVSWESLLGIDGKTLMSVYTRSDACGAAEIWASYLGGVQEDLKGIGVYGDPGIADIVKNDPLGIGFNNIAFAYNINTQRPFPGLTVIPIDVNGNGRIDQEENFYDTLAQLMEAIADGRYPSPPARDLYLVSNGLPTNAAALEFLKWIFEKGQAYVNEAGYVSLPAEKIDLQLEKLSQADVLHE